jgi:hypothetical protein
MACRRSARKECAAIQLEVNVTRSGDVVVVKEAVIAE